MTVEVLISRLCHPSLIHKIGISKGFAHHLIKKPRQENFEEKFLKKNRAWPRQLNCIFIQYDKSSINYCGQEKVLLSSYLKWECKQPSHITLLSNRVCMVRYE